MQWLLLAFALLMMSTQTGCRRPFQAMTESTVRGEVKTLVDGNIDSTVAGTVNSNVTGHVNSEVDLNYPFPTIDSGVLVEMQVARGETNEERKIALIDVDGLLVNKDLTGFFSVGENPVSVFREKLDHISADKRYCALVIRINSPGGGVTATDVMWRDLKEFQHRTNIPVVACLMDVSTGGAYYLATAADRIVAHPTTLTGGIGCILNLYYLEDLMGQLNISSVPIKAGENIDLGSPVKTVPVEGRALLESIAAQFHDRFKQVVRQSRPQFIESDEIFDGRVLTAQQALDAHLVDSLGYLDDTIEVARGLCDCPTASVMMLHRPRDPARSPYAITPNMPLNSTFVPFSVPGLDRSKLPTFMYLWQPNPSLESIGG
jgi:protease-4